MTSMDFLIFCFWFKIIKLLHHSPSLIDQSEIGCLIIQFFEKKTCFLIKSGCPTIFEFALKSFKSITKSPAVLTIFTGCFILVWKIHLKTKYYVLSLLWTWYYQVDKRLIRCEFNFRILEFKIAYDSYSKIRFRISLRRTTISL